MLFQDLTIKAIVSRYLPFSYNYKSLCRPWPEDSYFTELCRRTRRISTEYQVSQTGASQAPNRIVLVPECPPGFGRFRVETVSACGQPRDVEPRAFALLVASFGCPGDKKLEHNLARILPAFETASCTDLLGYELKSAFPDEKVIYAY